MKRVFLDASGLLAWFAADGRGRTMRSEYEQGVLRVVAHRRIDMQVLAALTASGQWPADSLVRVAAEVDRLEFELHEPPIDEVAAWMARGLTADQAGNAALASTLDLRLITDDPELLRRAGTVAHSIADA